MPQETVNSLEAAKILHQALIDVRHNNFQPTHPLSPLIRDVMLGTHLTYRYILITNILAKATNPYIHALALQARADVNGAFDSRSLCHNVIVSADRDPNGFAGRLGRSNEPYLNKPARYETLDISNAVRRGNDKALLHAAIHILSSLKSKDEAYEALLSAVFYVLQRDSLINTPAETSVSNNLHPQLVQFGQELLAQSHEGETCAILSSLSFKLIAIAQNQPHQIRIHPVNQAGSSSNEVLDIDVYINGRLHYSAEVKDKFFTINDIDHAATKARAAGLESFFFITGPRANSYQFDYLQLIAERGMRVTFVDCLQFYVTSLGFINYSISIAEFWKLVEDSMNNARIKDLTRLHVISAARKCHLIQ